MHGPLRVTYALLANYMAKCQMSSGPYGPILQDNWTELASFQFINSQKNKGKYCVKYIYFYNIK